MEIAQLNKSSRDRFIDALNNLCGEANEAALHATDLLADSELIQARRELARIMEIVEGKLMPLAARAASSADVEDGS